MRTYPVEMPRTRPLSLRCRQASVLRPERGAGACADGVLGARLRRGEPVAAASGDRRVRRCPVPGVLLQGAPVQALGAPLAGAPWLAAPCGAPLRGSGPCGPMM